MGRKLLHLATMGAKRESCDGKPPRLLNTYSALIDLVWSEPEIRSYWQDYAVKNGVRLRFHKSLLEAWLSARGEECIAISADDLSLRRPKYYVTKCPGSDLVVFRGKAGKTTKEVLRELLQLHEASEKAKLWQSPEFAEGLVQSVNMNVWRTDFQQILSDLLHENLPEGHAAMLGVLRVANLPLDDHMPEWEEVACPDVEIAYWTTEDYLRGIQYAGLMLCGAQFPPFIASCDAGLLMDGYHRFLAAKLVGLKVYPQISLNNPVI